MLRYRAAPIAHPNCQSADLCANSKFCASCTSQLPIALFIPRLYIFFAYRILMCWLYIFFAYRTLMCWLYIFFRLSHFLYADCTFYTPIAHSSDGRILLKSDHKYNFLILAKVVRDGKAMKREKWVHFAVRFIIFQSNHYGLALHNQRCLQTLSRKTYVKIFSKNRNSTSQKKFNVKHGKYLMSKGMGIT